MGGLFDGNLMRGRRDIALLRQGQLQHAAVVFGLDGGGVDAGDVKAATERAVPALPADEVVLFLLGFFLFLGGNGQAVAVDIDADVLFGEAGQIGLDQVMIALVENIGFAGEILFQLAEIAEKAAFQVGEGVHIAVISVFKRNKIKHKAYLHTSYWTVSGSLWMAAGRWKPCKIVRGRIAVCNAQPPSFLLMLSVYPPFFTENRIRYE